MASTLSRSTGAVNAEANNVCALMNNGYLRVYTGVQPANADTGLSSNTLLAELRFAASAFGASSGGLATAAAIASQNAIASGTATFFRALQSDGTTVVMDGSTGTSGCDLNLNSVSISSGAQVTISSFTYQATK